ncbi:MAG: hypothetical protein EPO07_00765 [Verrucomicrobia bacterium]|nr:MAG: hypothetical protein EPO07_00765 [Verrucomicrobiota bacterium]
MKKLLVALCFTCALALAVNAQEAKEKKHEVSAEHKALIEKYDTNKDGKLDKEEKSKMTKEDKQKWADAAKIGKKKEGESKEGEKK